MTLKTPYPFKKREKDKEEESNSLNLIPEQTQLDSLVTKVDKKQTQFSGTVMQKGDYNVQEYTNSDGTKLYTPISKIDQGSLVPNIVNGVDINKPPSPQFNIETSKKDPAKQPKANPNDLTDPNNQRVKENAIINQNLRKAGEVYDRFDLEEKDIYTSVVDQYKDQTELSELRAGLKTDELDFLEEQEVMRLEEMQRQVKGAIGANRATFSQSREGVQSASYDTVRQEFETEINKQLDSRVKQHGLILRDINLKRRELEIAKKSGDTSRAESLAEQLASAQNQLRKNEIEYIDALGRQIDQQLKVDNQFMQKFEMGYSMMASGQQFSQEQLIGMANEFGLPAEMMLNTYQSLEQVRADKSLTLEQKALQTQEVTRDFQMRSMGYFTEQQQSAKMFMDMYQSGKIDKQQLGEMFAMSGIQSTFNPLTQAELAMQQAQLQIQQRKLNGQPVGFSEMREYYDRQIELMDLNGELMGYQPTQSLEGISTSYQNGELVFDLTNMKDRHWECGEFVNRTWGLPSGGSGGFASLYSDKLNNIDIPAEMVNETNFMQTIRPGMAFVMPASGEAEKWGHVGIVTKVYPDGTFDTMEANYPGDKVKANVVSKTRSIADVDGFTKPPVGKAEPVGGQVVKNQEKITEISSTMRQFATGPDKDLVEQQIANYVNNGDNDGLRSFVRTEVIRSLSADDRKRITLRNNIVQKNKEIARMMEESGLDMGIFTGSLVNMRNKIGGLNDPDQQAIAQFILLNLEDFGRAQTGAAIQDFERKNFEKILPSLYDGGQLTQSKMDAFARALELDIDSTIKLNVGDRVYDQIFTDPEPKMDAESIIERYTQQNTANTIQTEKQDLYSQFGIN